MVSRQAQSPILPMHSHLAGTAILLGMTYDGAAALLHGCGATVSAISASAHCTACNGLKVICNDFLVGC